MKKDKIKPFTNYILIEVEEKKEVSEGGIVLPGKGKEKIEHAEIISLAARKENGNGAQVSFKELKPGLEILVLAGVGHEVPEYGERMRLITEGQILAIVQKG